MLCRNPAVADDVLHAGAEEKSNPPSTPFILGGRGLLPRHRKRVRTEQYSPEKADHNPREKKKSLPTSKQEKPTTGVKKPTPSRRQRRVSTKRSLRNASPAKGILCYVVQGLSYI